MPELQQWVMLPSFQIFEYSSQELLTWNFHPIIWTFDVLTLCLFPTWWDQSEWGRGVTVAFNYPLGFIWLGLFMIFFLWQKKCINFVFKWYYHIAVLIYIPWEIFEDYLSLIIVKICYTYITYVCILNTEIQYLQSV